MLKSGTLQTDVLCHHGRIGLLHLKGSQLERCPTQEYWRFEPSLAALLFCHKVGMAVCGFGTLKQAIAVRDQSGKVELTAVLSRAAWCSRRLPVALPSKPWTAKRLRAASAARWASRR
eukprot:TRINITY_DN83461_c0_g1_i1.p4 TRINITY_DN83461_c0_g1~~TRINITY_DN83461_c0_g1_i1.p4  ORF type:complete len:118 (+),score=16.28 TRINITY_DN83461_c0_g1_i1:203-556(+)